MSVRWQDFEYNSSNIKNDFEKLCRLIFKRNFIKDRFVNINQKANNPGIETDPFLIDGQKVGFQVKYFSGNNNYDNIVDSFNKSIKYYKNKLDKIILFCNNNMSDNSKTFNNGVKLLKENGIELELFCNESILDLIDLPEYNDLRKSFFGKDYLENEWFETKLKNSLKLLEPRYETGFHVDTLDVQKYFDVYYRNSSFMKYISDIINNSYDEIMKIDINKNIKEELLKKISNLKIPSREKISDICLYFDKFNDIILEIEASIKKLNEESEKCDNFKRKEILSEKENKLYEAINALNKLNFLTNKYIKFINEKILIIEGDAGSGKSHLLGYVAERNMRENKCNTVLLLGQQFILEEEPSKQIMRLLDKDMSFDDFLSICETKGDYDGTITVIMIDAINECYRNIIWETYLNNIITKVEKCEYVRLILSIRTTYKRQIFNSAILKDIEDDKIPLIPIKGFQHVLKYAIPAFFNKYNITISTKDYFNYDFINPLFLKIYCEVHKNNSGLGSKSIYKLYYEYFHNEEKNIKEQLGYDDDGFDYSKKLFKIIGKYFFENDKYFISHENLREEVQNVNRLMEITERFIKSKFLVEYFDNNDERILYLNYERFSDYIVAKYLIDLCNNVQELREKINDAFFERTHCEGIFGALSILAKEKFNIEIIEFIDLDNIKKEDYYRYHSVVKEYIMFIKNRLDKDISENDYVKSVVPYIEHFRLFDTHIKLLINLFDRKCELNANYLSKWLNKYSLAKRDVRWTIYINENYYEGSTIYEIVNHFIDGKNKLTNNDEKTLYTQFFIWLLSSSNRMLRDNSSRALTNILVNDVREMIKLLDQFNNVSDPYIISRLYGCIYGSILLSDYDLLDESLLKIMANKIYNNIFNKEIVYADILLRDYALNIVEYLIYNNVEIDFDINKCKPQYKSYDIPEVNLEQLKRDYHCEGESDYENHYGTCAIISSLNPNCKLDVFDRPYGDFGRYTFQSKLLEFKNIDIKKIFHYAFSYIINDLGYKDEFFSNYDSTIGTGRMRYGAYKERIGKKYQWIAMYHILALLTDNYKYEEIYSDVQYHKYTGAWRLNIRDYDPTLQVIDNKRQYNFNIAVNRKIYKEWELNDFAWVLSEKDTEFNDTIKYKDNNGETWYALYNYYKDSSSEDYYERYQQIWKEADAILIKKEEEKTFIEKLKNKSYWGDWLDIDSVQTYNLFLKEYVWSPAYKEEVASVFEKNIRVKVDKEKKLVKMPHYLINYDPTLKNSIIKENEILYETGENVYENVGVVKRTTNIYTWEKEYDYSKKETISIELPTKIIIDKLKLKSKQDGVWIKDNDIVCADFKYLLNCNVKGLLIKEKYLNQLLQENDLSILWICVGEKRDCPGKNNDFKGKGAYVELSTLAYYDKGIIREIKYKDIKSYN